MQSATGVKTGGADTSNQGTHLDPTGALAADGGGGGKGGGGGNGNGGGGGGSSSEAISYSIIRNKKYAPE